MFAVIYTFKVKPGFEAQFKKAWKELTVLIYNYEGSLGSRLHQLNKLNFVAYAQWPDKEKWKNSGAHLPAHAKEASLLMKESCEKIETLFQLTMVEDMLQPEQKSKL